MFRRPVLTTLALLLGYAIPVQAADEWQFRLTPYLWFAGLKGDVATIPGLPAAPIDLSPSDALNDTEASLMFVFDASKGQHGVFFDFLYSDVQSKEELIPQPIGLSLKSVSKTTLVTLAYQYTAYSADNAALDLLVGGRYWDVDTELRFGGGPPPLGGRKVSHAESWIDPALGIKGRMPLGDSKFYLEGGAGIGGFGVGSDLFYEFNGAVGYQWSTSIGTTVGYRMFDVDYEDGDFLYDARQQGWQLGLTWAF